MHQWMDVVNKVDTLIDTYYVYIIFYINSIFIILLIFKLLLFLKFIKSKIRM